MVASYIWKGVSVQDGYQSVGIISSCSLYRSQGLDSFMRQRHHFDMIWKVSAGISSLRRYEPFIYWGCYPRIIHR